MENEVKKVCIVGWDGATFDLIRPWVEQGLLPNIARLLRDGVSAPLRSTIPPMTFTAWSSFMTGRNPGQHGVYDFTRFREGTYDLEFVNGGRRQSSSFWRMLSDAGKKVISISVPCTFPPEKVNGIMLSGFDAPGLGGKGVNLDATGMYPPEMADEINAQVGGHPLDSFPYNEIAQKRYADALESIIQSVHDKARTAKYLLTEKDWDCFMILFGESDGAGHYFWHHADPNSPLHTGSHPELADSMLKVYQALDAELGELEQQLPEGTQLIMMSDHGFGGISNTVLYPNCWLQESGQINFRGAVSRGWSRGFDLAKKLGLKWLPVSVKRLIYKVLGARLANIEGNVRFAMVDWDSTRAFFDENPYYPTMWINLKGRQPRGTVEPGEEYEELRTELIERLHAWTHPETGEPIVRQAYRREDVYHGACLEQAPDIVIHWNTHRDYTFAFRVSSRSATGAWTETLDANDPEQWATFGDKSGHHRDDGIFLACGSEFQSGVELERAHITDVCPTIMHLLDVACPDDMDGHVLTDALRDPAIVQTTTSAGSTTADEHEYTAEEEEMIAERLRALGYIN